LTCHERLADMTSSIILSSFSIAALAAIIYAFWS
jgi:hypothetical protein